MDFEEAWEKALKKTEIVRARVQALMTQRETPVPYILLSESSINVGDTVVRQGEVLVDKPAIVLPPNNPQFTGFEFEQEGLNENSFMNFLLVRGITIPSLRYDNKTVNLDVYEGNLNAAVKHYEKLLQSKENVTTGLILAPEDVWQFSILIFICTQIAKNADTDIRKLLNEYKRKKDDPSN